MSGAVLFIGVLDYGGAVLRERHPASR